MQLIINANEEKQETRVKEKKIRTKNIFHSQIPRKFRKKKENGNKKEKK